MLVPKVTWLVIEDAYETNDLVEEILRKSGLRYYYTVGKFSIQYITFSYHV